MHLDLDFTSKLKAVALLTICVLIAPAQAGVFSQIVDCSNPPSENFCEQGTTKEDNAVNPFAIVHPFGYQVDQEEITIKICIQDEDFGLAQASQEAIDVWNRFTPQAGQCKNCWTVEDPSRPYAPGQVYSLSSILMHEIGHCAMGLGHPNLQYDPPGLPDRRMEGSFTMSYGGSTLGIDAGPDGVPGSGDDIQQGPGGARPASLHWFRISDNNPFVIDEQPIDSTTYSRSVAANLPSGWSANANYKASALLKASGTQTPMYSVFTPGLRYEDLTADDTNMIHRSATGPDEVFGTSDDYTFSLEISDCSDPDTDIRISWLQFPDDRLGECRVDLLTTAFEQLNPMTARHFVYDRSDLPQGLIRINRSPAILWDTVFFSDFESGDAFDWTGVVP